MFWTDDSKQQQPVATSQHSDSENTLSCFITCPLYQVLPIQVGSLGFRCGTGEELYAVQDQQGHCTWLSDAPLAAGMSTLLAEICQHPQCPQGTGFTFRTAALAWALKL